MRCEAVLSVTFVDPGSDSGNLLEELRLCTDLLSKKYKARGDVLFEDQMGPIEVVEKKFRDGDIDVSAFVKAGQKWAEDPTKLGPGGLGLYIQMHATRTSWRVPPENLAQFVAFLYGKLGLRFRKINLSGCFTAGSPDKHPDPSDSLAKTFCDTLQLNLANHCDWLNKVMVAGYRAPVTFKEKEGKVRNVEGTRPIRPTPPYEEFKQLQKLSAGVLSEVAELDPKRVPARVWSKIHTAGEAKGLFDAAVSYIGSKVAWQFSANSAQSGTWARISLAAYTENEEMRNLIHVVEKLYTQAMPNVTTRLRSGFVVVL